MNQQQATAIRHHCRLAGETVHARFAYIAAPMVSVVLTVNSGYE